MIDNRSNDRYIVDTPESIEFGYDVTGIGPRFLAAVVDNIMFGVLMYGIYLLLTRVFNVSDTILFTFLIGATLLQCCYYIALERFWNGQTPGKRVMGIRTVQEGGRSLSLSASVLRNLVRIIDFFPAFYGLGIIVMLIDKRTRRLGDLVAGTLVVRDRQRVTLDDLLQGARSDRVASALQDDRRATLPNLARIRPDDVALVQDFLARRTMLPFDRRQRLAGQLAYALFQRLGYSVPGDPELFLQQAVDQYITTQGHALIQSP